MEGALHFKRAAPTENATVKNFIFDSTGALNLSDTSSGNDWSKIEGGERVARSGSLSPQAHAILSHKKRTCICQQNLDKTKKFIVPH
jgi:hypothetical protein